MRSIALILCTQVVVFSAITSQKFILSANFQSLWNGHGRDSLGNVYVAAGNNGHDHLNTNNNAAFFKFNFKTNQFDMVGTIKDASEKYNNWRPMTGNHPNTPWDGHAKIHTTLWYYEGKMFFGSHYTLDGETFQDDLDGYKRFYRGSHLYAYDIKGDSLIDMNGSEGDVMCPNNGLMDIAIDYHHKAVFGIGYPEGIVYRHDLVSHKDTAIYQSPDGNPNKNGGAVTRNLIMDNSGTLWFITDGKLKGFNYNDRVSGKDSPGSIDFPAGYNAFGGHVRSVANSATRDSIYFVKSGAGKLYRLRVKARKIDIIDDNIDGAVLAIRWDQNKLYYLNAYYGNDNKIRVYDILTGTKTSETVGGDGIKGQNWTSIGNTVDKNGDMWLTSSDFKGGEVLRIDLPEMCDICGDFNFDYGPSPSPGIVGVVRNHVHGSSKVRVYPYPFNPGTLISFPNPKKNANITIFDIQGVIVKKLTNFKGESFRWNAPGMSMGMYLLKITIEEERYQRRLYLVN